MSENQASTLLTNSLEYVTIDAEMCPSDDIEPRYTLELIPGTRIALFHWFGPITYADRELNLQRMSDFCREHGVDCILIDGRDQQSETDIVDSYDIGSNVPEVMSGLNIAVVHRPDDKSLQFIETVAFNRGGHTRSFEDLRSARAWLESIE